MPRPGLHMGGMGVANASSWAHMGGMGVANASSMGGVGVANASSMGGVGVANASSMGGMGVANASSWADDHFLATQKAAQFLEHVPKEIRKVFSKF